MDSSVNWSQPWKESLGLKIFSKVTSKTQIQREKQNTQTEYERIIEQLQKRKFCIMKLQEGEEKGNGPTE